MALFTNLDLGVVKPLDLKDYKPSIGESMSIAWDEAMEQNPMQILARRQEMTGWEDGLDLSDAMTGMDPTTDIDFEDFRLGREVHALPLEEQARQIRDAGLEGQIKPVEGYRQEALDIVMGSKQLENAAGLVSENQGIGGTIAGFGAGLAASFMDPINIASAFVPVAGEARVMSLIAGASGIGQRAAIRAGLGAASGALGAAMIEPMIYLGQQEVQADYTLANSMLNMSFGAIMGGVMHAGGGTFAEWRRARSGKAQPWEYVPPDDDSMALMQAHAEEIARFRQEANPNADPELIRQSALADASLFDSHARNWAYHEKKTVGEYYQQNRPEYRSWRDIETPGWQEAVHDDWRVPGSQIGDKLDDMAWVGPEYAGLTRLNADAMTMPEFLKHMDEWEKRFPEMADYDGIRRKIQEIQVSKAYDWREAVPAEWRSGAKEGEALQDLGWAGPEYAGLKKIDADAMPLPEFLENLKLWEERFPDRFDYAAIRQSIDDVQSGKRITAPDTLFHLDGNGNAISPGENNPRIAKVVDVKPDLLVHKDGTPVNLMSRDDMFKWLRENLQGLIVKIADDGTIQKLTRKELNASLKRRGLEHSQAYANLVELLENALFDSFEKADARHARKVKGQNVYYSAAKIGNDYYTLKIKVDIPLEKGWNKYKDHKISKIEIAPSLYRDSGGNNISGAAQNQSAISGISLSVLKGDVKPSRIENNTLFQSAPSRSIVGRQTQILGANSKEIGRYEVREMDDVIASHDPENQFRRRENYPQEAQERPYHSDEGEQQKAVGNALNYEPAFVVSTDASATNGPPIITQNGIVLGGNSRTMTLQMVYGQHPEKAAAYRQALVDNASQFGIDPNAIANMKRPMLVRVVSGKFSPEDMAKRSREYNQTTTQQLQGEAEGISRARFVDKPTVNALIAGLQDGRTIDQFLASPESADFARVLQDAGVLQQQEVAALTHSGKGASGKLNDAGKARVKMIMRGLVLPDYDVMTSLPKGVLDNLDAAIPGLALSRFRGEGFDLTGAFYDAMRFVAKANNEGTPVEHQFFQHSMIATDPARENAVVQALAMTFANADAREIRLRMEQFLELADSQSAGQASLMPGMGMTPQKAFRKSFLEPITFVGNERVANFKPDANPAHAAIQWAIENGGKNPTVEKALAHIEKKLVAKKTTPEDRSILSEYQRELAPLSGALGTREPKLGQFFKDPGNLDIPAPKKPGERGALPEATATREPAPLSDPDANLPPELQAEPDAVQSPRGQVQFDAETGRAVVTFFQSADVSTAPHELFHIFRREIERTALTADGSAHAKEQWRKACEFVGAKDGQAWTREMEEKFADAGLQYLREGRAPTPGLRGLFERLKSWFMDLYQKAEDLGVEISPQMREVFDGMFTVPYDAADRSFRYAMGDLHSRQVERDFADPATSGGRFAAEDQRLLDAEKSGDAALVDQLMQDAQVRADEAVRRLEQNSPELRGLVDEANLEIAEIDRQIEHNSVYEEFSRQAMECRVNGG